jgi:hypothetical protein
MEKYRAEVASEGRENLASARHTATIYGICEDVLVGVLLQQNFSKARLLRQLPDDSIACRARIK